jgi:hypothetical protein
LSMPTTLPTPRARVRPMVPVPQQMSKTTALGPAAPHAPAVLYSRQAAALFTWTHQSMVTTMVWVSGKDVKAGER